jgi:hypothetical protein
VLAVAAALVLLLLRALDPSLVADEALSVAVTHHCAAALASTLYVTLPCLHLTSRAARPEQQQQQQTCLLPLAAAAAAEASASPSVRRLLGQHSQLTAPSLQKQLA